MRPSFSPARRRRLAPVLSVLALLRIDFAPGHEHPVTKRLVLATIVSVVGSLAADAALVAAGTAIFPSTKGYVHFAFSDYARLTVVGVIIASAAWPVVTRISSAPRWVFVRTAVLVTTVLYLPDLYLLVRGDPAKAVAVLMAMHLAIGVVTYSALVRIAPAERKAHRPLQPGQLVKEP